MEDVWAIRGVGGVCKLFQTEGTVYTAAHVDDKEMIHFLKKCSWGKWSSEKKIVAHFHFQEKKCIHGTDKWFFLLMKMHGVGEG